MNGDDNGLNSDLHAIPNISFLFVGEVLYVRNATIMKSYSIGSYYYVYLVVRPYKYINGYIQFC